MCKDNRKEKDFFFFLTSGAGTIGCIHTKQKKKKNLNPVPELTSYAETNSKCIIQTYEIQMQNIGENFVILKKMQFPAYNSKYTFQN